MGVLIVTVDFRLAAGYGATTLPGITEAITLDGDPVAVAHEIERLKGVIDNLVEEIRVHT